jgi:predicted 2-oxoglutarate/Fe(II)-dependent dioxygenase YbiX|tara:strand:+ start:159 stop:692 length:534 start_codon:yes stop_codon:yes gene_type:complete
MNNLKDFIKVYDNVLDKDICKKIIKTADKSKFKMATLEDKVEDAKIRNCYNKPLSQEFETTIFETVGNVLTLYQNDIGSFADGAEGIDTGYIHLFYKGSEKGKYETHIDHFSAEPRLLSISILLNDNFDGGSFCFFNEYVIEKKVGSAIAFPSNFMFPHAVLPVSNGDRHSIITWIR